MKKNSIEKRNSRNGFLFVLPWCIGIILFFIRPIIQAIYFSFSNVKVGTSGFVTEFIGIKNFRFALYESPEYVNNLIETLSNFAYQIPIILILSFILAVVLNGNFKGRTFYRSVFFIPVIVANSVMFDFIKGGSDIEELGKVAQSAYLDGVIDFEMLFLQMGIPTETTNLIFGYADRIFDLIWQCGVQTVLFISGLQSIPEQLYEVSKVEGASKWEEFWFITVPMLGNTMVLVAAFTVIEFCVSTSNSVITQAYTMLIGQQIYGKSLAMLWIFFLTVAVIMGVVYLIFKQTCLKKWN